MKLKCEKADRISKFVAKFKILVQTLAMQQVGKVFSDEPSHTVMIIHISLIIVVMVQSLHIYAMQHNHRKAFFFANFYYLNLYSNMKSISFT